MSQVLRREAANERRRKRSRETHQERPWERHREAHKERHWDESREIRKDRRRVTIGETYKEGAKWKVLDGGRKGGKYLRKKPGEGVRNKTPQNLISDSSSAPSANHSARNISAPAAPSNNAQPKPKRTTPAQPIDKNRGEPSNTAPAISADRITLVKSIISFVKRLSTSLYQCRPMALQETDQHSSNATKQ